MKLRTIIWKLLLLGVVLSMTGCGNKEVTKGGMPLEPQGSLEDFYEEEEEESVKEDTSLDSEDTEEKEAHDYTKVYSRVLEAHLRLIKNGGEGEFEGSIGVSEAVMGLETEEALSAVGYIIQDISGDGIPELLIGEYSEEDGGFGTMIYALYNCTNGVSECVFEGWYRNAYHWMGDGMFTYSGSGGAIYSMFGTAALSKDGTALEWQDYYFTYEKDENFEEIGCYHNTTGEDNPVDSEVLDISLDDFWDLEAQILEKRQWLQLTSFAEATDIELPEEEASDESDLERVRRQITENGDICAVGYLGYFDGTYEELGKYFYYLGILQEYDFLSDVDKEHFIDQEGYELYFVVPKTEESSLIINDYVLNEIEPVEAGPGVELGRFFDGQPVLLRGNISEVIPNLYFEAENPDGTFIAYNPSLSLRDGSLTSLDGIYDLTPYEPLGIVKEPIEGEEFLGSWSVVEPDRYEHTLGLNSSGECFYGIVDDEGEVVVVYSGWWEMAGGELNLTLWEDYESIDPAIFGTYLPEILGTGELRLTWSSGEALTTNMYYDGYEEFSPAF